MSSEEKKKILQMVEAGTISAEEAMSLIKALEEKPVEAEVELIEPEADYGGGRGAGLEFEEIKARAQKFAIIPLGIGVVLTVLGAYWMFALVGNANYGFWFFCAWFPLLLGILLVALTSGGMNARWLYVNVDQQEDEWPQHITLGLPVPLGVVSWFLRNFGQFIRGLDRTNVDGILSAISAVDGLDEPLIVNVDEGDGGERVQVYIG